MKITIPRRGQGPGKGEIEARAGNFSKRIGPELREGQDLNWRKIA